MVRRFLKVLVYSLFEKIIGLRKNHNMSGGFSVVGVYFNNFINSPKATKESQQFGMVSFGL